MNNEKHYCDLIINYLLIYLELLSTLHSIVKLVQIHFSS